MKQHVFSDRVVFERSGDPREPFASIFQIQDCGHMCKWRGVDNPSRCCGCDTTSHSIFGLCPICATRARLAAE